MKDIHYIHQKYIVNMYANRMLTLTHGKGVYLYDDRGNAYLDMMSNYGVNIFGYHHPIILKYLSSQLKKLTNLHGSFHNDMRAYAAQALVKACGGTFSQVHFTNSGTEAIETALKFAVLATGKKKFIACQQAFHGKTLGALSLTYAKKYRLPFEPLPWHASFIPYNNPKELEKAIDGETAAFIVEPVQGESGVFVPDANYLKTVRSICSKKNILLIIDEIQTGMGRTGKLLASQWQGVSSDILCLGKGLAGGIPVGATLVTSLVSSRIPKHIHTSTFGGNPLSSSGICAVLKLLDKKRLNLIIQMGGYFLKKLNTISSPLIKEVRGTGLMIAVEVVEKRNEILKKFQENKILAIPAGETAIRFLPPYIVEKKHVDCVVKTLQTILLQPIPYITTKK